MIKFCDLELLSSRHGEPLEIYTVQTLHHHQPSTTMLVICVASISPSLDSIADVAFSETVTSELKLSIPHRKGARSCTSHALCKFVIYAHLSKSQNCFLFIGSWLYAQASVISHITFSLDKNYGEEMMVLEYDETWALVQLLSGEKTIGC